MTFNDFISKFNGQVVDTDGYYSGQCMDLMHKYIVDCLGLDLALFAAPTAYEAYKNANDARFDKIANTPTGVPQKGDIIFWNTTVGNAGHVAIFISGDANSFKSFDQNWPTGSKCHIQDHDYKGVTGWLHFKSQQDTEALIDELRKARDDNWNKYQAEVLVNNDLTKQLQDEQRKTQELRDILDQQTKADADLGTQLLDAEHATDEVTKDRKRIYDKLSVATTDEALEAITALQKPHEELVKNVQPVMDQLADAAIWKRSRKSKSLFDRIREFLHL